MKKTISILALCLVGIFVGCSSTSTGRLPNTTISIGTPIAIQGKLNDQERLYLPDLVRVLENRGFRVTNDSGAEYTVQMTFNSSSSFNVYCNIVLSKNGVPIISANGTNPGWGVWLARGSAYRGVFESALNEFERKLAE